MELSKQVCSLDLAKRLKELGVKQESLYYLWTDSFGVNKNSAIAMTELRDHTPHNPQGGWQYFSAFTVAELGEILPVSVQMNEETHWLEIGKTEFKWQCGYTYHHEGTIGWGRVNDSVHHAVGKANTEVDARAKMLCYLLENKLITP